MATYIHCSIYWKTVFRFIEAIICGVCSNIVILFIYIKKWWTESKNQDNYSKLNIMIVDLLEFFQKVTLTTTLQTNNVWQCLLQKILSLWWMKSRWARIYFTHILFTVPSRYVIRIQPYLVFKFRHLKETPTGFEQTYI